jgi:hypothetical protein
MPAVPLEVIPAVLLEVIPAVLLEVNPAVLREGILEETPEETPEEIPEETLGAIQEGRALSLSLPGRRIRSAVPTPSH